MIVLMQQRVARAKNTQYLEKPAKVLLIALLIAIISCACGTKAFADDPSLAPPPVHQIVDANGINLNTGAVTAGGPSISIGQPGKSGLTYSVTWDGRNWQSNLVSSISYNNARNDIYTVTLMGRSATFQQVGTNFNSKDGMGETLVLSGSSYIFTARDGTVAVFDGSHTFSWVVFTTVGLLTTVTYPSGEVLTFTNQIVSSLWYQVQSVNSTLGYQLKLFYDSSNNLTQVVAINSGVDYCAPTATSCSFSQSWPTLNFTYPIHSGGWADAITDSKGNTTTGTFTSTIGQIESRVTYPSGRYLSYVDNDLDNMFEVVTDGTSTWNYSYNILSSVVTDVTDPLGHVRQVTSDPTSGVMQSDQLDPSGLNLQTSYYYDSYNRVTQITYPLLNVTTFAYDSRGNILTETQISSTPGTPANVVTSASFPTSCSNPLTCNKPTSITDANTPANTTYYTYNSSNGAIATVTSPPIPGGNAQKRYTYTPLYAWYKNSSGSIVAASTPVYMLTQTSQCLLPGGVWPLPGTSNPQVWGGFVWSSSGNCVGTSQENLATYSYQSGSSSLATNLLPTQVNTGSGNGTLTATVNTTYDTIGNVAGVDGPILGHPTVYFYDADRNQVGIIKPDPDGSGPLANPATKVSYNGDNQVLETDQGTTPSQSFYDFTNNFVSLVQTVNGYSSVTGAKTGVANAVGGAVQSVKQYSFDGARNPLCIAVRQTSSLFGSLSSPFGSLPDACTQSATSQTDLISHNDYDHANRVTATESGYGSGASQTTAAYTYTNNSKIATIQDANSNQSAYTYDGLDRVVQLNFPDSSYETYGYDGNGNLIIQRLRSGENVSYSYDGLNRQIEKSFSGGSTASVYTGYDLTGNVLYAHYGSTGGSGVNFAWDALGRKVSETSYGRKVISQYDLAGNRTFLTYPDGNYIQYTYDVLNRMQKVEQNGSTTAMVQYAYDNLGRVSSVSRSNGATTNYSYDSTDLNWSLAQNGISQSVTFGMSYTPAQQVSSRTISNPAYAYSAPALSQIYSPNGLNQYTSVGGVIYGYDPRGNLTSNSARALNYDLENHLISTSFISPSVALTYDPLGRLNQETVVSTTEQFLYDGDKLIVEYDNSGNVLRRYVPGQAVDETLVWYEGSDLSAPNWLHTDQQGSVIATSNASGTATTYTYSASGEPNSWSGPRFRYTGQAAIPELALYYYKARMYDPGLGRFLQTDPVGYTTGFNLYAYTGNDPANNTDPMGKNAIGTAPSCDTILVGEDYMCAPDSNPSDCPPGTSECTTIDGPLPPKTPIVASAPYFGPRNPGSTGGFPDVPYPQPSMNLPPSAKKFACDQLKANGYHVNSAEWSAYRFRNDANHPEQQFAPAYRLGENWLAAASHTSVYSFDPSVQGYKPFIWLWQELKPITAVKGDEFSRAALEAGLNGADNQYDTPAQLKELCDN